MRRLSHSVMIATAVALISFGCASSYQTPPAAEPAASGQDISTEEGTLTVSGLVQYGSSWVFWHKAKGQGTMSLSPDRVVWRNSDDRDRSFTIQPDVVKSVTLRCAARAGGNLCLELMVRTVTDLKYYFRDADWAAGQNDRIMKIHDWMETHYPSVVFQQETVDEIS